MRHMVFGVSLPALLCMMLFASAVAQEEPLEEPALTGSASRVATIKPNYFPPAEILDFLGVSAIGNRGILEWETAAGFHTVEIRHNNAANLLVISGDASDVAFVEKLITEADIPPRQIEIEVKIIEISTSKAQDLGVDWARLVDVLDRSRPRVSGDYMEDSRNGQKTVRQRLSVSATLELSQVLEILDESGAGTIRTAPRILTLNNRRATILDGQRVTYVTRYSSYTNLFETDSMDAGLTLSVLPSLGESGYVTLRINAELTTLGSSISGSPVKDGQMLENTIIVRDGETVLLGGLSHTIEETVKKRFPILGHVLPFLFSREITIQEEIQSFIVLTPRVVDFATTLDEGTKSIIEDK